MGDYWAKNSKQGYGCYTDLSLAFSVDKSIQRFNHDIFRVQRKILFQMMISLINVNPPYKRATFSFSELLLDCCFLKIISLKCKIILMPRMCVLGWQILLSFNSFQFAYMSMISFDLNHDSCSHRLWICWGDQINIMAIKHTSILF